MLMMKVLIAFCAIFLSGCSGISLITPGLRSSLYTEDFLAEIESVKQLYAQGQTRNALSRLRSMNQEELRPTEIGLKRNLIGVIYFSEGNYEQAIFQFDTALSYSRLDDELTAQIHLNLASSYFRLDQFERSMSALDRSDYTRLTPEEALKHHRLHFALARELNRDRAATIALIRLLGSHERVAEIRNNPLFQELNNYFFRLSRREKLRVIEGFESEQNLAAGYLAYLDAERAYYQGNRQEAIELLEWIERRFARRTELVQVVQGFVFRLENFSQMDQRSIGVILPLSGERREFGERALLGIDAALQESLGRSNQESFQLHIVDSQGAPAVGAYRVNDLVEQHNVSVIIGGLFSGEAEKQYREAKKRGVLFISLSQLYIPQSQKNHLLIEIPGSIESQINELFSNDMLDHFGRRAAIIYPDNDRGEIYINEFWRMAQLREVQVSGVVSYEEGITDFRDPVRNLLGLKFDRNREEETELLESIHALERTGGVRRVQTLKPQIDFDWVFIPSYPMEAVQIIPSFNYFDAAGVSKIGVPSWRSRTVMQQSSRLGELFFIGDDVRPVSESFRRGFFETYKEAPRIIELRGYDAMGLVDSLLAGESFDARDAFEFKLREVENLKGLTGVWTLNDNLWLKEMTPLQIRRGQIRQIERRSEEAIPLETELPDIQDVDYEESSFDEAS